MTNAELSALIRDAITLKREIDASTEMLDLIKARLREEARFELAKDGIEDTAGSSFTFNANDGSAAHVSFPKPGLVKQIQFVDGVPHVLAKSRLVKMELNIKTVCGDAFKKLFAEYWKPAKAFEELLGAVLPPAKAERVLWACQETPQDARVSFEVSAVAKDPKVRDAIEPS